MREWREGKGREGCDGERVERGGGKGVRVREWREGEGRV